MVTLRPVLLFQVDDGLATQLSRLLEPVGVGVTRCQYGPDTLRAIAAEQPALLVAGLSRLPDGGEMVCHQISRLSPAPLILAIVRPEVEAAVAVLDRGAVACVSEPAEPHHLAAQIVALLRLTQPQDRESDPIVEVGGLSIDYGRCRVVAKGRPLPLTPTEFRILGCLAGTPGRVMPPSEVMRQCVGLSLSDREAMELLKVHVYRLRRKLKAAGAAPETLRSARGFGYMLERRAKVKGPLPAAVRLRWSA